MTVSIQSWRNGGDSLIQCVVFDKSGEEAYTEFMSGDAADDELSCAIADSQSGDRIGLLVEDGAVYGYTDSVDGSRVEYWDCDEQTWSEYLVEEGCVDYEEGLVS